MDTKTIIFQPLDEQDNVTYEIELSEAFPRSLNLLELNNSAQNQTHRLNVLFAYRYWKDISQEYQTTPIDVPRQLLNPSIPVVDTRLTDAQANAARASFARTDPRRIDLG